MGEEKRKAQRINKSFMVQYCPEVAGGNKKWDMTTIKNISETGMCLTANKYFPLGSIMSFLIKIPFKPDEWIDFKGKVVSADQMPLAGVYALRVEFVFLKEESRELLRQYVAWYLKANKS